MLSDPLVVTVDGSPRSLPRVGTGVAQTNQPKVVTRSNYKTGDGAYAVHTAQYEHRDGGRRVELTLFKEAVDSNSEHFYTGLLRSGVGVVFELSPYGLTSAVDIANLRSALIAFLDSGIQSRLLAGEA